MTRAGKLVSVVIPVHDEAASLPALHQKLQEADRIPGYDLEFVYVDDGSRDETPRILADHFARDRRVRLVRLRRRFGKSAALEAGFRAARGNIIVTLDGDLQDDPADLAALLARLDSEHDLVVGWRQGRRQGMMGRLITVLFNLACRSASGMRLRDYASSYRVLRREVADEIRLHGELHLYIPVLARWRGFRITEHPVRYRAREHGRSRSGPSRYLRAGFDFMTVGMLTRFEKSPLYVFGFLGVALTAIGFLVNAYLSVIWFTGSWIGSRPLLLFGVLLMIVGIQTTFFGLLAELIVHARSERLDYAVAAVRDHEDEAFEGGAATKSDLSDKEPEGAIPGKGDR
jgi:glycosyltransferase involved in cell wall biosynthesis